MSINLGLCGRLFIYFDNTFIKKYTINSYKISKYCSQKSIGWKKVELKESWLVELSTESNYYCEYFEDRNEAIARVEEIHDLLNK